jgi:putative membrane protein
MQLKVFIAAAALATLAQSPTLAQSTKSLGEVAAPPSTLQPERVDANTFVQMAANSDMLEIQSSELALKNIQDKAIQEFAKHMVEDHQKSAERLKSVAQGKNIPTTLDSDHAKILEQLQRASGKEFALQYVQMQLAAHQKAVTLFENYAANGDDPKLKEFAQQTAPSLREHLRTVEKIRNDAESEARKAQGSSR